MFLSVLEQRFSLCCSQLAVLLVILSQVWFSLDNPRLLAGTALNQPLTLQVERQLPDRHVSGVVSETGEAVQLRLARREAGAQVLTIYRTQSQLRPWLTGGQVKAMQPFFTLAGVTFSWRLFLAAAVLAGWLWLWRCYQRRPSWQPVLREMALWSGRGFAVIALLVAASQLARP